MSSNSQKTYARRLARKKAVQALYQWDMSGADILVILKQFDEYQDMAKVDLEYFEQLVRGVPKNTDVLDNAIGEHISRSLDDLDPIERNILRLCSYELSECIEIPYRVVINEAVELTKVFGAEQGHKFVNGVIDKVAKQFRPVETQHTEK